MLLTMVAGTYAIPVVIYRIAGKFGGHYIIWRIDSFGVLEILDFKFGNSQTTHDVFNIIFMYAKINRWVWLRTE